MAFEIGWVPDGWTRGEPLTVKNFRGALRVVAAIWPNRPFGVKQAECLIEVRGGEQHEANAWLKWWRGE